MENFSEGLAVVVNENGKYGYVDTTDKIVIPFKYKRAENFINGKAKVLENNKEYFINKKGKKIIK